MNHTLEVDDVKQAARGQWPAILQSLGELTAEQLNPHKHGPCPKCNGTDRFRAFNDVAETGGVICNNCHDKGGDGLATLQWLTGKTFSEVLRDVAAYLGITSRPTEARDIIADVARAKKMPLDAFRKFGAEPTTSDRNGKPVARVPMFDGDGQQCSHFDIQPSNKGFNATGKPAGVFLPGRKPEAGETWLIVEGCKDAAALVGLGYLAVGIPTYNMATKFAPLFAGVHVVIVGDLDTDGQRGADLTGSRLYGVAASVRVARLPGEIVPSHGADVRDALQQEGGETVVRSAIDNAAKWEMPAADGADGDRPAVEITLNESKTVGEVLPPLGNLGWTLKPQAHELRTFQRGGALVHIITDPSPVADITMPNDARRIRTLPAMLLRERIGAAAYLFSIAMTKEGPECRPQRPPSWLIGMIHERGQYPRDVRPLAGVVSAPTLRPDGSILQTAGYDAATGLMVELSGQWPTVPEKPSKDEARRAADDLLAVVADFPFVGPAHRSGWLALVLTLLARPAIRGPVPLFCLDANTRGSGKSLQADAAGIIATGDKLPRKSWTADDDEIRKTITAVALEALPVVLFDNVAGRLGCASFDAALAATSWTDRILGQSATTGTLPLSTVWAATGNNVVLDGDTARRTQLIKLESPLENPEERTGFAHPDLLAWVRDERRRLAVAGLTVLRGFIAAGRPDQKLPPWGTYEAWSDLVRNAIVWAGLTDPAETRAITRDADRSAEIVRLIHAGLLEADTGRGVTTADVVRLLEHPTRPDEADPYPTLRAAVGEICGAKINAQRIGTELRKFLGRVADGQRLIREADTHSKVARWSVVDASDLRGLRGPAGTFLPQSIMLVEPHSNEESTDTKRNGLEKSPLLPAVPAKVCPKCGTADSLAPGSSGRLWCVPCECEAVVR